MWKYQHPDFALFILGELQKQQQQGSVFCDVLLQTEGVCVPAHSCVLAAHSPVFSRILSASPALHTGQNRLLNLEAVGSQALLKVVGFLYTGKMEVESHSEHEGLMAVALRFGLKSLKRLLVERSLFSARRQFKDYGAHGEGSMSNQERDVLPKAMKSQSSTTNSELPLLSSGESRAVNTYDLFSKFTIPSLTDHTEKSVSNHHDIKTKSRCKMAQRQFKLDTPQQNQNNILGDEGTNFGQIAEMDRNPQSASGKDFRKLLKKDDCFDAADLKGPKRDQLKVKIKLRRRKGACWESKLHVSLQGEADAKADVKKNGPQSLSSHPGSVSAHSLGTLTPPTDQTISPSNSHSNASSDRSYLSPQHGLVSSPLVVPGLPSTITPPEESDEQIALLLEDMFTMGLNILPLMPLDSNLEEGHFTPPQEQKDGQRESLASFPGVFHLAQTVLEKRESDAGKMHEGRLDFQTLSNSEPLLTEGLFLTPKTTAVTDYRSPVTDDSESVLGEKLDFKLHRCLSPLDSECGNDNVSIPESKRPSPHQNLPSWLSKTPTELGFPLCTMIHSSCPKWDQGELQNLPTLIPPEVHSVNPSFSLRGLKRESDSAIILPDLSVAPPQEKKPRRQRKTKINTLPKLDDVPNTYMQRFDERKLEANKRAGEGVKRRRDVSSPLRKKRPRVKAETEHPKQADKQKVVKHPRKRPPKSKSLQELLSKNNKILCLSVQDSQKSVEEEQIKKQNSKQKRNSKDMEETPATNTSLLNDAKHVKGPHVINQTVNKTPQTPSCCSFQVCAQEKAVQTRQMTDSEEGCEFISEILASQRKRKLLGNDFQNSIDQQKQIKEFITKSALMFACDDGLTPTRAEFISSKDLKITPKTEVSNNPLVEVTDGKKEADSVMRDIKFLADRLGERKEDSGTTGIIEEAMEGEEMKDLKAKEKHASDGLSWDSANGCDEDEDISVEVDQCTAETKNVLLKKRETSSGPGPNSTFEENPSNEAPTSNTGEFSRDTHPVQNEGSNVMIIEDVPLQSNTEPTQSEEDSEVDVLEVSSDSQTGLVAKGQLVTLLTKRPIVVKEEQEVRESTEEEEVDIIGEETD